jgi:hypothetical protein
LKGKFFVIQEQKKGPSHFAGKRRFYFQEEAIVIPVAVSHPPDYLDFVVHALENAGIQSIYCAGDDALDVALETAGWLDRPARDQRLRARTWLSYGISRMPMQIQQPCHVLNRHEPDQHFNPADQRSSQLLAPG